MRVLVVEDDKRIADGLVAHLAGHGHAVDTAGNLATGWAALCAEPFDLLLLDLGLPHVDGLTVVEDLRARGITIPILVLTAYDLPHLHATVRGTGANDLLQKPYDPEQLLDRMHRMLAA